MVVLGRVVERAIGGAQRARVQVETRGGLKPILSLESMLPSERVRSIMASCEDRLLNATLSPQKGKPALEVGEAPARFLSRLLHLGASSVVGLEIGGSTVGRQGDAARGFTVRGLASLLPFRDASFEYATLRLATPIQGDLARTLTEAGRVLTPGSQGVLIDFHPFGLYARHGSPRLRPLESPIRGLEDYYRLSRSGGLRVIDLKEVFVDESMRNLFSEEEIQAYRQLKGTPLLIALFLYKPKLKQQ